MRKKLSKNSLLSKNDYAKVRIVIKILLLGVVAMFLSLFYIWSRIEVVKIGYEIGELQKEQKLLKAQTQKLKMELSVLKSPTRIEKLALENLKMVWPTPDKMYKIKTPSEES